MDGSGEELNVQEIHTESENQMDNKWVYRNTKSLSSKCIWGIITVQTP